MAKKNKSGASKTPPQSQPNPQPQQLVFQKSAPPNMANLTFTTMSDQEAQDIRDLQDSAYDPSVTAAVKMYISNTNYDGQGHSLAQSLNYKLDNDLPLDASEDYTDKYIMRGMHQLGKDTILQSGKHDDWLQQLGIQNYSKLSQAQLQKQLVGVEFDTKAHWSTSYDVSKNPFLSNSSGVSGGREVVYNIKCASQTNVIFGAKAQSEIIIGKGAHVKITGVKYTGNTVTPRLSGSKKQIMIDVEVY